MRLEHRAGQSLREKRMGRPLAALVIAVSLATLPSSEAAAWVCRAVGLGSGGFAQAYDIIDAKLFALRQCERLRQRRPGGGHVLPQRSLHELVGQPGVKLPGAMPESWPAP